MSEARWRDRLLRHRALLWPLAIALLASVFLLRDLGERRLQKSDEALFASAALQMTRDGGVLYPARGEFGAYDTMGKPPGAIWVTALSISVFGRNNFAARLPTALAGVATLVLLYLFGTAISGRRVGGVIAALLLLTQGGWLTEARTLWLENSLSALFLLAVWLDAHARQATSPRSGYRWQVATGVTIGFAALVKHLVGLAPLGAIVLAELLVNPRIILRPRQLLRRFGATLASVAAVFGWWVVVFLVDHGRADSMMHLRYKWIADRVSERKGQDVANIFTQLVEPWVLVAGLICLLALVYALMRRGRHLAISAAAQQRAYLVVAVAGLVLSHVVVFCVISDKLRAWYMLPVIPLLVLAIGAVWGSWLGQRSSTLRLVALATLVAATVYALPETARWYTFFAIALGAGLLGLLATQLDPRALQLRLPLLGSASPATALRSSLAIVLLGVVLLGGMRESSAEAWKEQKPDLFLQYLDEWRAEPPPHIVIDAQHWARWIYMQPMVYWYWSPMEMVPHRLKVPCDISTLPPGTFVMLHHTNYQCVQPRARQTRNLTPWWRMVRLN